MRSVRETASKIKTTLPILTDEPMAQHTTLRIGGAADVFARPVSLDEVLELCRFSAGEGLELFVLGGGANILVSDRGIRGLVLDMRGLDGIRRDGRAVVGGAGAAMSDVSDYSARAGLGGLEFIYAMPGSVGGSVWMNARCYGASVSDVLESVRWVDTGASEPVPRVYTAAASDFAYKHSPFQELRSVIIEARFALSDGDPDSLRRVMEAHRQDRTQKGHFLYPSAGSAFKNNPDFGKPTGRIIDEAGLRGWRAGGAAIAEYHGNIVINTGSATALDVLEVLRKAERVVRETTGLVLEREVLLVGDWNGIETSS